MQPNPLIPALSRDIVAAIAHRPDEPETLRNSRETAALLGIQEFEPRDGVEIMLAGLAVTFQSLIADAVRDSRTATDPDRLRRQCAMLQRAQMGYLREFRLHRKARYPEAPHAARAKPQGAELSRTGGKPDALPPRATAQARATAIGGGESVASARRSGLDNCSPVSEPRPISARAGLLGSAAAIVLPIPRPVAAMPAPA